jgi:hypothetical protein
MSFFLGKKAEERERIFAQEGMDMEVDFLTVIRNAAIC